MVSEKSNQNQFKEELRSFLTFMFKAMGEDPDISILNDASGLLVEINIDNPAPYIGKQGEALSAIQHIVKAVMFRKFPSTPQFMIDIGEYKKKQITILKNI